MRRVRVGIAAVTVAATALLSGCGSSGSGSSGPGGSGSSSGGSGSTNPSTAAKSTYKVGFITSLTGPFASSISSSLKGAQARIALQNAQGGVNGHKLELVSADDGGTPTQALTAAQGLVENKNVMVVAVNSYLTSAMSTYLNGKGMPVMGANEDGPEWSTQPNTNMFGTWGNFDPKYPAPTTNAQLFKQLGITKIACAANNSPGGSSVCKNLAIAAKSLGLDDVYTNVSISLTSTDFTTLALAFKNSGAQGIYLNFAFSQSVPIMVALHQAGVKVPGLVVGVGYSQELLDNAQDAEAGQNALFNVPFMPVEVNNAGTKQMQDALAKYADFTGVPDYNVYEGWISVDMAIQGLSGAGDSPTSASIISAMQKLTDYTANGLETSPLNFDPKLFGTGPYTTGANGCTAFVRLTGKQFVPIDPPVVCGKVVQ